ncbi:MAG: putative toxin-antitoxin system toxin component, PIN family [Chloroflexota bacterium]|nr:putative toxin-antitoxin system toxin component, PIN family [Chloroflexota bacterium]
MMRVVLDTNVLVSALIVPMGKPARILRRLDAIDLLTTESIMAEVGRVLRYSRIQKRYGLTAETITTYLERLREVSTFIVTHTQVSGVSKDPDDDKFLECAVDGDARYIVSGDPHLLSIGSYEGISIVTPSAFLLILEGQAHPPGKG